MPATAPLSIPSESESEELSSVVWRPGEDGGEGGGEGCGEGGGEVSPGEVGQVGQVGQVAPGEVPPGEVPPDEDSPEIMPGVPDGHEGNVATGE